MNREVTVLDLVLYSLLIGDEMARGDDNILYVKLQLNHVH